MFSLKASEWMVFCRWDTTTENALLHAMPPVCALRPQVLLLFSIIKPGGGADFQERGSRGDEIFFPHLLFSFQNSPCLPQAGFVSCNPLPVHWTEPWVWGSSREQGGMGEKLLEGEGLDTLSYYCHFSL